MLELFSTASPQAPAPSVLWMDDQPEFMRGLERILSKSGMPLSIEAATSIDRAQQMLHEKQYSAFVADCRMSNYDPAGANGAAFLLQVNQTYPALPTFVCSAYLDDAMYEKESRIQTPSFAPRRHVNCDWPASRMTFSSPNFIPAPLRSTPSRTSNPKPSCMATTCDRPVNSLHKSNAIGNDTVCGSRRN